MERDNGNAWVAASTPITVCWPLPEGTTKDTPFELLHFQGLHREMGTNMIEEKIDTCTVEKVPITVTDTHVLFTVQPYQNEGGIVSGGFSPFVLAAPGNQAKTGSLTVSKAVTGSGGERNREWHFTVTLSDTGVSGTYGGMTFANGVATFALKDGGSATATGLPANAFYAVSETEANTDGYVTTSTGRDGHHPRRRHGYGGVHQLSARNVPWWRKRPERSANRQFQQGRTLGAAVRSLADGADRYLQALLPRKAVPEIRSVPPRRQSGRRGGAASEACRQTH